MSVSASVTKPATVPAQRGAAGAAQRVVAVYLAVTAPLLLAQGLTGIPLVIVALHAALVWWLWRDRPTTRTSAALWDWAPLLLAPLLYWELPRLMEGLPGPVVYHDPAIVAAERALFGMQPAYDWAGAMPWLPLSELLHLCYLSYYLLIYTPPLLVYLGASVGPGASGELGAEKRVGGDSPAFRETLLAVMLAFFSCFVVFVVMPVQGPRYLGVPAGVPSGPVRALVLDVLEAGSSRGAAFPSSHVSVSIAQALVALRLQPRVGRRILPIAIGLAAGAVYGGFHYGIDALVGAAVGVGAALAAGPLRRRIEGPDAGFTKAPDAV